MYTATGGENGCGRCQVSQPFSLCASRDFVAETVKIVAQLQWARLNPQLKLCT